MEQGAVKLLTIKNKYMTAVEWLFRWINDNPEATHKEYAEAFQQAKQMEKEQIKKAANTLLYRGTGPGDMWAEQYYNDTFKN